MITRITVEIHSDERIVPERKLRDTVEQVAERVAAAAIMPMPYGIYVELAETSHQNSRRGIA